MGVQPLSGQAQLSRPKLPLRPARGPRGCADTSALYIRARPRPACGCIIDGGPGAVLGRPGRGESISGGRRAGRLGPSHSAFSRVSCPRDWQWALDYRRVCARAPDTVGDSPRQQPGRERLRTRQRHVRPHWPAVSPGAPAALLLVPLPCSAPELGGQRAYRFNFYKSTCQRRNDGKVL